MPSLPRSAPPRLSPERPHSHCRFDTANRRGAALTGDSTVRALQTQLRRLEERKKQAREGALSELQRDPAAAIGSSPTRGQGKVRLIEFSDFQCPYCAGASSTLQAFLAKNGNKLSLTYKFYPLERIHPEALPSARAAWAAGHGPRGA